MDNQLLHTLLTDGRERQFWLKPVGLADRPLERQPEVWPEDEIEILFAKDHANVAVGDVLIAYRVGVAKVIFIAERLPATHAAQRDEQISQESRQRYPYSLTARNLTPTYGMRWSQFNIKPLTLAKEYQPLHPEEPAGVGPLYHRSDRARIAHWLGKLLIQLVQETTECKSTEECDQEAVLRYSMKQATNVATANPY